MSFSHPVVIPRMGKSRSKLLECEVLLARSLEWVTPIWRVHVRSRLVRSENLFLYHICFCCVYSWKAWSYPNYETVPSQELPPREWAQQNSLWFSHFIPRMPTPSFQYPSMLLAHLIGVLPHTPPPSIQLSHCSQSHRHSFSFNVCTMCVPSSPTPPLHSHS